MDETTLERLLGVAPKTLDGLGPFRVFVETGDGVTHLADADTIDQACERMGATLFGDEFPDYDEEVLADMPEVEGEPLAVRALLYELSERMHIERTVDPTLLVGLASVLAEQPQLRLVVAWVASAPREEFGVAIFRVAAGSSAYEGPAQR